MTYKFHHLQLVWNKCDITIIVSGGDCGEWRRGEIQHDPALLPRNIHQNLQEDDRHGNDNTFSNISEAWVMKDLDFEMEKSRFYRYHKLITDK